MKMKLFLILFMFVFNLISGCGQERSKENANQQTQQSDKNVNEETLIEKTTPYANDEYLENTGAEQNKTDARDEATLNVNRIGMTYDRNNEQKIDSKKHRNQVFKDVSVTETVNGFSVSGKAHVFEGVFQYEVVANGEVVKTEHYQTEGASAWSDFHFTIDESLLGNPESVLNLFVYFAEDGSRTNILTTPLSK